MAKKTTSMTSTIVIDKCELKEFNKILKRKTASPDYNRDGVIIAYTAKFRNGFEADIKVCNGDGPYVDPVLFDERGHEVVVNDVAEQLQGKYIFEYDGVTYNVIVK